jgi:hypothetical protein
MGNWRNAGPLGGSPFFTIHGDGQPLIDGLNEVLFLANGPSGLGQRADAHAARRSGRVAFALPQSAGQPKLKSSPCAGEVAEWLKAAVC